MTCKGDFPATGRHATNTSSDIRKPLTGGCCINVADLAVVAAADFAAAAAL